MRQIPSNPLYAASVCLCVRSPQGAERAPGSRSPRKSGVFSCAERVGAPVGAVLGGGYEPAALSECLLAMMRALGGEGETESIAPDPIYTRPAAIGIGRYWEM